MLASKGPRCEARHQKPSLLNYPLDQRLEEREAAWRRLLRGVDQGGRAARYP